MADTTWIERGVARSLAEPFPVWLNRQIATAKALYDSTTTPGRKRRYWDQYMLLLGVKAEYDRREQ